VPRPRRPSSRPPARPSSDPRRALPQIERLAEAARRLAAEGLPDAALTAAARLEVDAARRLSRNAPPPGEETLARRALERARRWLAGTLRPVLNGTGVPLHTNLGRAPLAAAARRRVGEAGGGYVTLEYDLDSGRRSRRGEGVEEILRALTGAEAALVVNNNAAAVLLALSALARGRRAVVSRGELIEIGGAFRLPEVIERSGAVLAEIGTTNRTHLSDYERALGGGRTGGERSTGGARPGRSERPALVLRTHPSNYRTVGFTARPALGDLAKLCRARRVPLVEDLGSGSLVDLSAFGLEREPTVQESLRQGVDLVTWSGDKLLGGPQAGVLLGRGRLVEACRRDPLARALRVDKLTLSALEATLALYFDPPRAAREIPVLRMLSIPSGELRLRAERLRALLAGVEGLVAEVRPAAGEVGGGSLPAARLESWAVVLAPERGSVEAFERALRRSEPPLVARLLKGRVWVDLRALVEEDEERILASVRAAARALAEAPVGRRGPSPATPRTA
jgi:L-seryl-tRNA(Ser) seleniumtransferase